VLAVIQQRQKTRDEVRLQSMKLTLRQKARIREQQEQAAKAAPLASSTSPHAYADFADYFKDFEQQQKDRARRNNEAAKQRRSAAKAAANTPSPPTYPPLSPPPPQPKIGHFYFARNRTLGL